MKSWRSLLIVSIFNLIMAVLLFIATIFVVVNRTEKPESQELPIMRITLKDVTLDDIINGSKETKYEGNELELEVDGETEFFSDVQVKGRGNSTWLAPKRPFQIKFKQKVDLLVLGPRKKYVLIANHFDESSLRDDLMVKFAEMIDEPYHVDGRYLELYFNDEYYGLFYLMTKVEIGKGSVDLRDQYGILIEMDTLHKDEEDCLPGIPRECLIIQDAFFEKNDEMLEVAVNDFRTKFIELQKATKARDFKRVSELIDIESFAKYVLVSKFSANADAFASSFNMYKDGIGDKIHAGPLWDHDYAYGNHNWYWSDLEDLHSPETTPILTPRLYGQESVDSVMYNLVEIPEFQAEVKKVFIEKLSGRKDEVIERLRTQADYIKPFALKNEEKWEDRPKFENEVEYLIEWVSRRYDHFESIYGENAK